MTTVRSAPGNFAIAAIALALLLTIAELVSVSVFWDPVEAPRVEAGRWDPVTALTLLFVSLGGEMSALVAVLAAVACGICIVTMTDRQVRVAAALLIIFHAFALIAVYLFVLWYYGHFS